MGAAGPESLVSQVHAGLRARRERVGCAESLTGGDLAAALSRSAGASATFVGGLVSYATEVKREVLGVTAARVISSDCAAQMAIGVRRLLGSDWSLATTGVAGPDRQEDRAVGTVYVGVAGPLGVRTHRYRFDGDRAAIRAQACAAALELLLTELAEGSDG